MSEDMSDRMPEDMPEDMPDRMPNRMSEDMSDRMPEDVPVRTCINVMVGITRSKVFFLNPNLTNVLIDTDRIMGQHLFSKHDLGNIQWRV